MLLAAPVPKNEVGNSKRCLQVLAELGLPDTFGKLSDVPDRYAITKEELKAVRDNPEEYPLRAVILRSGEAVAKATDGKPPTEFRAVDGKLDKKSIRTTQEKVAQKILELEEASDELIALHKLASKEPHPRWQAHYEFLFGYLLIESSKLHEYNRALGQAIIDDASAAVGFNGWQVTPAEQMRNPKRIRDSAKHGKQTLSALAKDHPGTPWADLAAKMADQPCGFKWEPAKLK